MVKVGIYVRVSTDEQAKHGYSLGDQLDRCRRRALEEFPGADIIEFIDEGHSGSTLKRPAMQRLRNAADLCGLVVMDPDRLSRDTVDLLVVTDEITHNGVRIVFVDMTWENTSEGRFFLSIRGAMAQMEREKIRQRTIRGKRRKASLGGVACPPSNMYGYAYDKVVKEVRVREDQAEVVRRIFQEYISGMGSPSVARGLNRDGIAAPKGGDWDRGEVLRILRITAYAGMLSQGTDNEGRRIFVACPRIVVPETFAAANALLMENSRRCRSGTNNPALLSGILQCGECGASLRAFRKRPVPGLASYYVCLNRQGQMERGDGGRCPNGYHRMDNLDATVWTTVQDYLGRPEDFWRSLLAVRSEDIGRGSDLKRLRSQMDKLQSGRRNLLVLVAEGMAKLDEVRENLRRIDAQLAILEAQDRAAKHASRVPMDLGPVLEWLAVLRQDAGSAMSLDERRNVLLRLVTRITVDRTGKVVLEGRVHPADGSHVGPSDDRRTVPRPDDVVAPFSSRGPTTDGVTKPDLLSPGVRVISLRAPGSYLDKKLAAARVGQHYFELSGTSMATPLAAGVAAQMLCLEPTLSPDALKERLLGTAQDRGYPPDVQGSGYLDAQAAAGGRAAAAG